MMDFFRQGGFFMWPILFVAVAIVWLAARSWTRTRRLDAPDAVVETGVDAVLFWGVWVLVIGLLGTFTGIYQAAGAIERAPAINPAMIWGGVRVALTTTLAGFLVFAVAALLWLGLRFTYRRKVSTRAG
jgi:biopolymer transport protein ExbB/TolQ